MVGDLRYFVIEDFDDQEFLNKLKNELPEAIRISKLDFDWGSIFESKAYIQRVKTTSKETYKKAKIDGNGFRSGTPRSRISRQSR